MTAEQEFYGLLYRALLDLRIRGQELNDPYIVTLTSLFHTAASSAVRAISRGEPVDPTALLTAVEEQARTRTGGQGWLTHARS
jgi:hypothetical protein